MLDENVGEALGEEVELNAHVYALLFALLHQRLKLEEILPPHRKQNLIDHMIVEQLRKLLHRKNRIVFSQTRRRNRLFVSRIHESQQAQAGTLPLFQQGG